MRQIFKKHKRILLILLIIILLLFANFVFFKSNKNTIIVIADRKISKDLHDSSKGIGGYRWLQFYRINCDNSDTKKTLKYNLDYLYTYQNGAYNSYESSSILLNEWKRYLPNLIYKPSVNSYFLLGYSPENEQESLIVDSIKYYPFIDIIQSKRTILKRSSKANAFTIKDIDSQGNLLLDNNGKITSIVSGSNSDEYIDLLSQKTGVKKDNFYITGATFLNDNSVVLSGNIYDRKSSDYYFIALADKKKNQIAISIYGFPSNLPAYKVYEADIHAVSPDKQNILFWSVQNIDKKDELVLSVWNFGANTMTHTVLPNTHFISDGRVNPIFRWNPVKGSPLVCIYTGFEIGRSDVGQILVIDTQKNKIKKRINTKPVKDLRWSNNGKRVAYLQDGNLFVFDLSNVQPKLIDYDVEYFDFFWVD
jgi:hypothetical protein